MEDDALAVFAEHLRALRSYAKNPPLKEIVRQAHRQRPPVSLSPSTLSDWFNGRSAPDPNPPIRFLLEFLRGRAIAAGHRDVPPLSSYERLRAAAAAQTHASRGGRPGRPEPRPPKALAGLAGAVRARDADPFHLGVHRPIRIPGSDSGALPPYVPRDVDLDRADGVRRRVEAASRTGGFILLVGGSSVGKSRCLYEAVHDLLPDWWLLQPATPAELAAVAARPPAGLVIWLDELQNHLDGDRGLTAATMRSVLRAGVVVVATLWSRLHATWTAAPLAGGTGEDRHAHERELLKLAEIVHLPGEFSLNERWRARKIADEAAANGDLRLNVALKNARFKSRETGLSSPARTGRTSPPRPRRNTGASRDGDDLLTFKLTGEFLLNAQQSRAIRMIHDRMSDSTREDEEREGAQFGFTQTIAAAPQLIERWKNADPDELPYAHAVLAAAVDAERLGARAPLSAGLLRAAAPGYCTPHQRAHAAPDWFDAAMEYATRRLHGATAALVAVSPSMAEGAESRYRVADYLLQHVTAERSGVCPPATFWEACRDHLTDAADLCEVGFAATDRLRFGHGVPLLRRAAELGEDRGLSWLDTILTRQGRVDELIGLYRDYRVRHGSLGEGAAVRLADHLVGQERVEEAVEELRLAAGNPHGPASLRLADLLDRTGAIEELRSRAAAGNPRAAAALAGRYLKEVKRLTGDADPHVIDGPLECRPETAKRIDGLLEEVNGLLKSSPWADPTVEELRSQAEAGDSGAVLPLARKLKEKGELDEAAELLGSHPQGTDRDVVWALAEIRIEQNRPDEAFGLLRELADAGDHNTTIRLSELLVEHGRDDDALELLRSREAAGDPFVFVWLDYLLARRGDADELLNRVLTGDVIAFERMVYVAADLLIDQGKQDEAFTLLREAADRGNREMAMGELTEWLTRHGLTAEAERLERLGLSADGFIESDEA